MRAQIVHDRVDPLDLARQPALDLLQERHPAGGAAPERGPGEGLARGGLEGTEDVALAAPTVVDLLLGTPGTVLGLDHGLTGIGLGALGAHLVEADETTTPPCGGAV